jgi:tRNA threonylcarbamoyladenosine biosynthesis protein TsaE
VTRVIARDATATRALGARIADALVRSGLDAPLVIGLSGELGAGKTTLVGGLLAALGHKGPARSPTYALVESYRLAGLDLHHCDLYRLRDPAETEDLGLRDLLQPGSVLLVEWPERAGDRLHSPDLALRLSYGGAVAGASGRVVEIAGLSEPGRRIAESLSVESE